MKKEFLIISSILSISVLLYPTNSTSNGTGSPGGKTGSIGDNNNTCTGCHYAGVSTNATISTNIPSNGYMPGQTYTITTTVQQTGITKFGFEVTAEIDDGTGAKTGSFLITNSTETKLINMNNAVTHKAGGTLTSGGNIKIWEFDWTAPSTGVGDIKFWGSYIAANNDGGNGGDTYHSAELVINEAIPSKINEIESNNNFYLYSNKIIFNKNINSGLIYDITGKNIATLNNIKNNNMFNLNNFEDGIYIIKTIDNQNVHKSQKISITKK